MTHSPGPWRLAKSGQIVDVNNRAIARIWDTGKRDQDRANGELIANAPEMCRLYDALCIDVVHLASKYSELHKALALCVRAIDNLLPDIGLINEALLEARSLVE